MFINESLPALWDLETALALAFPESFPALPPAIVVYLLCFCVSTKFYTDHTVNLGIYYYIRHNSGQSHFDGSVYFTFYSLDRFHIRGGVYGVVDQLETCHTSLSDLDMASLSIECNYSNDIT